MELQKKIADIHNMSVGDFISLLKKLPKSGGRKSLFFFLFLVFGVSSAISALFTKKNAVLVTLVIAGLLLLYFISFSPENRWSGRRPPIGGLGVITIGVSFFLIIATVDIGIDTSHDVSMIVFNYFMTVFSLFSFGAWLQSKRE